MRTNQLKHQLHDQLRPLVALQGKTSDLSLWYSVDPVPSLDQDLRDLSFHNNKLLSLSQLHSKSTDDPNRSPHQPASKASKLSRSNQQDNNKSTNNPQHPDQTLQVKILV
jgi:hypothetical protein